MLFLMDRMIYNVVFSISSEQADSTISKHLYSRFYMSLIFKKIIDY
jgi:hypothetical protein